MKMRVFPLALGLAALLAAGAATAQMENLVKPQAGQPGQVELGKKLYFDPRLSKSGFISCNSCHNLSMGGTDNIPTSIGDKWQQGPINAPTVLNSSLNVAQFWDGRAADLKAQAGGPIANPGEMAFSHTLAIGMLDPSPPMCVNSSRSSARTRSTSTRSRWPSPSSRRPWSRPIRASTSGCWARRTR
jgi:cytochrome c peroxidase